MIFKSPTQPLCRCCGKPIAKDTRVTWLRRPSRIRPPDSTYSRTLEVETFPLNTAECAKLTNRQVTAVSYGHGTETEPRHITSFHDWDGESWKDEFFCTNTCARSFARLCAMHQTGERPLVRLWTRAYNEAIEKRNQARDRA